MTQIIKKKVIYAFSCSDYWLTNEPQLGRLFEIDSNQLKIFVTRVTLYKLLLNRVGTFKK